MKILHVMINEKFTRDISSFYNYYFPKHEILYLNFGTSNILNENLKIIQHEIRAQKHQTFKIIYFLMKNNYDKIVVHSLFLPFRLLELIYAIKPIYKKIVWIEWGGDLYDWKNDVSTLSNSKFHVTLLDKFRANISTFVSIFPPDIDVYRSMYPRTKAKIFYAPYLSYPFEERFYRNRCCLEEAKKMDKEIIIQIGQNADKLLNHIEVLKVLRKFSNENIKLFIPLSYSGTKEYVDEVTLYANTYFPNKTIILKDFMPKDEYLKIIENVSIAIFHSYRQCGLYNIQNHIFNNTKLFLTEKGVMYNYFKNNGIPVEKFEDINDMDYTKFVSVPKVIHQEKFDHFIEELASHKEGINLWNSIYSTLEDLNNE